MNLMGLWLLRRMKVTGRWLDILRMLLLLLMLSLTIWSILLINRRLRIVLRLLSGRRRILLSFVMIMCVRVACVKMSAMGCLMGFLWAVW